MEALRCTMALLEVPGTALAEIRELEERFAALVERELRAAARRAAQSIGEVIVAQGSATAASPDDLNSLVSDWRRRVTTSLMPFLERLIAASAGAQIAGINTAMGTTVISAFDEELITRLILSGAENRMVGIGNDLWQNARQALADGVANGESIQDIARAVQDAAGVTAPRATTVARTEVIGASNKSSIEVMRASGIVAQKRWIATFDNRVRLSHIEAHGQIVNLEEPFTVGGAQLDHPGDFSGPADEVINCRCTMGYVVDEDVNEEALTAAARERAGAMIALVPSKEDQKRLALDCGESIDIPLRGTLSTKTSAAPAAVEATVDWYIERNHEECSEERPWAVVKAADGSVEGCHATNEDAVAQLRALLEAQAKERDEELEKELASISAAAETAVQVEVFQTECPPGQHPTEGGGCEWNAGLAFFEGVAVVEGEWTGDGRQFAPGSLTWEDLNSVIVPLQWQKETNHGGINDVTVSVGRLTALERSGSEIRVSGYIDTGSEDGAEVVRRLKSGTLGGVSIVADDPEQAEIEYVYPEGCADLDDLTPKEIEQVPLEKINECLWPNRMIFHSGRIRALTLVDTPAFVEASIRLIETEPTESTTDEPVAATVVSQEYGAVNTGDIKQLSKLDTNDPQSAAQVIDEIQDLIAASHVITIEDVPPAEWFEEPAEMPPFGALTVTDEGRVYGLLAPRDVAHRGFQDKRVTVPMGNVDYSRWMNRETIVQGGKRIRTGVVTMDCGHAPIDRRLTSQAAMEHYDNTCSAVITARVGESSRGVWLAGALLPGVTPAQVTRILACAISGDWRPHPEKPGMRELAGALLVPVPGFPVEARANVRLDHGELVASSVPVTWKLTGDLPDGVQATELDPIVATVIGSTDLPVAERDTPWDGAGALNRVFEMCTDGDNVDTACVSRAFLYRDPDQDAENRGAYKLGFADVINGVLQIVPRGVAAAAGGRGVDAADIPADEKTTIKNKICSLYSTIRAKFDDWPECPFDEAASSDVEQFNDEYANGEIEFADWVHKLQTQAQAETTEASASDTETAESDVDFPSWDEVQRWRELRAQQEAILNELREQYGIEIGV